MFGWMYRKMFKSDVAETEDPRLKDYPVRAVIPNDAKLRTVDWKCSVYLNQGEEGACTGFAVAAEAAAEPFPVPHINDDIARAVYRLAQTPDHTPGEDYSGSAVTAAM